MPCLSDNVASSKSGPHCITTPLVGPLKSEDKREAHPGCVMEQCNNTERTRPKGEDGVKLLTSQAFLPNLSSQANMSSKCSEQLDPQDMHCADFGVAVLKNAAGESFARELHVASRLEARGLVLCCSHLLPSTRQKWQNPVYPISLRHHFGTLDI